MVHRIVLIFTVFFLFIFFLGFPSNAARAQEGSLVISWEANTESDLAGYRIYYGTASRSYSRQIDVGNVTQYQINHLENGKTYFIAVTAYDYWNNESDFSQEVSGKATFHLKEAISPEVFLLFQNYPNPFNPITTIRYSVPVPAWVRLSIFDERGQLVTVLHEGYDQSGQHTFLWNGQNQYGQDVASGTYFARLSSGKYRLSQKLLLVR